MRQRSKLFAFFNKEQVMRVVFLLTACVSIAAVVLICAYLLGNGIPTIREIGLGNFFGKTWKPSKDLYGIVPMIIGSIYVTAGAIVIGVPIGLLTAIYMARFCPKWLYRVVKPAVDLMAGIPSIVYGFFGLVVIVPMMQSLTGTSGKGLLTASILLGIMILPTIIGVAETSIRAVPESYYEGSLALGATHERSVFFAQLPAAASGVMSGVILGVGRAIGETMAVIMIAGNQPIMPRGLLEGLRTMTANIVIEMGYASGLHRRPNCHRRGAVCVYSADQHLLFTAETEGSCMSAVPKKSFTEERRALNRSGKTAAQIMATSRRQNVTSLVLTVLVRLAAILSVLAVVILIGYVLVTGVPHLKWDLFAWKYTTKNQSMMPALINTICITLLSLLVAVPVGVFAAIYLAEYAKRGNKLVKLVRLTAETLSGIPSIVYGLFGLVFFNITCRWNYSMLSGAMTLAIMILPLILRTTEEALLSVPDSYREGSFGLGAGRLRTVFKVILPPAAPGILAGVILAIGRIVGESAALIFTSGSGTANLTFGQTGVFWKDLFAPLFQSTRTLSVHMYNLMNEGLYMNEARATAVVLLALVIGINALSALTAKRLIRGKGEK